MATATYDRSVSEVLKALENPRFRWRTVNGVAADTGIPDQTVQQILQELPSADIVRTPSAKGRLYTTRRHYDNTRTLTSRLLSVFSDSPK